MKRRRYSQRLQRAKLKNNRLLQSHPFLNKRKTYVRKTQQNKAYYISGNRRKDRRYTTDSTSKFSIQKYPGPISIARGLRKSIVCTRRKFRRLALFGTGKIGNGKRVTPYRIMRPDSKINCRR